MLNYQLITQDGQLQTLCEQARQFPRIALDTEFVRTRTYYPQLGLIQLFDGVNLSLIDPLAITDWQPFIDLLADSAVVKILHACSEDLEVFLHAFSQLPVPMIDTQVLAAFTGKPLSRGFAAMVLEYHQVALDKSESRTDWLARPLSEKQCSYAAADVYWLLPMAEKLLAETEQAGWMTAARQECDAICLRRQDTVSPELAYRDITHAWQLRTRQLACLQKLAAWRLRKARERDMAVNFVVREENLWQVARFMPGSLAELDKLGLSGPEIRYHGNTLVALVQEAEALADDALPEPVLNLVDHTGYRQVFKRIKEQIALVSQQTGLSVELLASRRQINQLLSNHWGLTEAAREPELVSGWRGALMGDMLTGLLQGAVKTPEQQ
ncbi:ribonuclease D [Biostraticola tofi]|uniref:Ribonuclease D n=1 Tax=Biostraticola tofi TaxID=466109 RepID=A0A4R3Z664_9GAMM|nr:ribonuclease D [Biostraticola tofi]TCV99974.1 ribonuclease D [Biostraticola tofi]